MMNQPVIVVKDRVVREPEIMNADGQPIALASGFRQVNKLTLSTKNAQHMGLTSTDLTLRRIWPRAAEQFGLECVDDRGKIVTGQWFQSDERLQKVYRATRFSCKGTNAATLALPEHRILLQTGGADRRLLGLAGLLKRSDAQLVVHRPERRAVVKLMRGVSGNDGEPCFAKVVRPERVAELADKMQTVYRLAQKHFQTPKVLDVDEQRGILWLSTIPGASLYTLLDEDDLVRAAGQAGRTLRTLHALAVPTETAAHDPLAEIGVINQWLGQIKRFAPELAPRFYAYVEQVCGAIADGSSAPVLLHRDFYDKQVFVAPDGRTGLLDLDTLAAGEGALDVANALVHFELRAIQGRGASNQIGAGASAFLNQYQPSSQVQHRLNAYADGTRLRLACVYAFRPYGVKCVPGLLERIGRPVLS